ncbi:MAG: hypothetical protein HOE48_17435 [Candidatus Latescibacteria bacterium]|nr:hypothetical protein [Candidatus Latescibacterota bacterium]MBT4139706.1 hypothetical protein [Candidatus Latescibacterota bacterium]MBT5829555.1 hypothetical protein [Candidatus Latescibacterota bacterium]
MDWIYLVLIVAFVTWSVQIYLVYHRQVGKIQDQIEVTRISQQDVTVQAEEYEARALELTEQLADVKSEAETLDKTEKGLEQEVSQYREKQSSRRPTRHRVEIDKDSE